MYKILEKIKPSKEEQKESNQIVRDTLKIINKVSKGKATVGGSGAKETWLSGTKEIDIFVKYGLKYKDKDISKILEKELKKKFKITKLHGSRDYFQIKNNGYVFEVVPVLDIKKVKDAVNITDVSPFHALWVKKHKKYTDDIRLVKQFAKAAKVYGAESYLRGFSGYVLEILVIYYKGFDSLVRNVAKWKAKVVIDPEKLLKNPLKELNESKIISPLIVVDPVDKTRNAAASLSDETFKRFISYCKKFLKKKSERYFVIREEKVPAESIVLEIDSLRGKPDVIGARLVKIYEFVNRVLKKEGYKFKSGWNLEKSIIWYNVKNKKLSASKVLDGPPIRFKDAVKKFRNKHKRIYVKGKRCYAKVEREHPFVVDFLKNLVKRQEIKRRVKSIKVTTQ